MFLTYTSDMSSKFKLLYFTVPLSFVLGIWFGFNNNKLIPTRSTPVISIFSYEGFLTINQVSQLESLTKTSINLMHYTTAEELHNILTHKNTDLVIIPSFFAYNINYGSSFKDTTQLQKAIDNSIHADFKHLLSRNINSYLTPLLWRLDGLSPKKEENKSKYIYSFPVQPESYFHYLKKESSDLANWVKTNKLEKIKTFLQMRKKNEEKRTHDLTYSSQGTVVENGEFTTLPNKSQLIIDFIAISKKTTSPYKSHQFLSQLYSPKAIKILIQNPYHASVSNSNDLPLNKRASFLRNFELNEYITLKATIYRNKSLITLLNKVFASQESRP